MAVPMSFMIPDASGGNRQTLTFWDILKHKIKERFVRFVVVNMFAAPLFHFLLQHLANLQSFKVLKRVKIFCHVLSCFNLSLPFQAFLKLSTVENSI